MSFLLAAYAVVLVTLAAYALRLRARRRRLTEELGRAGSVLSQPPPTPPARPELSS